MSVGCADDKMDYNPDYSENMDDGDEGDAVTEPGELY